MLLKKSAIFGCALVFTLLPFAANAKLTTFNYTKQDSTVKITSNGNFCAGHIKYTPASKDGIHPGKSDANAGEIIALCKKDPCIANIYMNRNCDGDPVAVATLTGVGKLDHNVKITKTLDPKYAISATKDVVTLEMAS